MDKKEAFLNSLYLMLEIAQLNKRRGAHYLCIWEEQARRLQKYFDEGDVFLNIYSRKGRKPAIRPRQYSFTPGH
jgi:hypothetical protein